MHKNLINSILAASTALARQPVLRTLKAVCQVSFELSNIKDLMVNDLELAQVACVLKPEHFDTRPFKEVIEQAIVFVKQETLDT